MPDFKKLIQEATPAMTAMRRDIHRHPELGYEETRTAALIEESLGALEGMSTARITGTGVVGVLAGGRPGPCLLLRADIDALPIEEETGLPFASENPGVMHACGHDGHAAILVAAAKILSEIRDELAGTVKFVFEPNEEEVGALAMIEAGVLENPRVDAAAALHLWASLPLGKISVDDGVTWAGMDHFTIKVKGRGGHTATPHVAVDPILVASQIVVGLQALQSRELDPFLASSLVFGRVTGGRAANVIPDEVELEGTIRYLFDGSDEGPHKPKKRLVEIAKGLAASYRAQAEVDFYCSQPPMFNDPRMAALGREAATQTLGPGALIHFLNMGGEDFSEFSARVPSVMAMVGAGSEKTGGYAHHHPKFDIDEGALPIALEWLLRTATNYLALPQ
ncbi:MAG: amidohydrolase [Deltaproteobacteria bacterium]|nr:amidohydrolase [Deltaproteobacteria bacterium]